MSRTTTLIATVAGLALLAPSGRESPPMAAAGRQPSFTSGTRYLRTRFRAGAGPARPGSSP